MEITECTVSNELQHNQKTFKNKDANKAMLLKAYGYLGGYEANTTKNYERSLDWFQRFRELDEQNEDINRYIGILEKWIEEAKGKGKG